MPASIDPLSINMLKMKVNQLGRALKWATIHGLIPNCFGWDQVSEESGSPEWAFLQKLPETRSLEASKSFILERLSQEREPHWRTEKVADLNAFHFLQLSTHYCRASSPQRKFTHLYKPTGCVHCS